MLRSLKAAAVAAALSAAATLACPVQAGTLLDYSGGTVWADYWSNALNTVDTSPIRWSSDDVNSWYHIYFDGHSDGYTPDYTVPGLAADLKLTLESVSADGLTWTFSYDLTNTSNDDGANLVSGARVADFSFDVDPNETGASIIVPPGGSATAFNAIALFKKMTASSTVGTQDICVKSGQTNNCNGGGSDGPQIGQTWSGGFSLTFASDPDAVVLTDPMVRFQSLDVDGFRGASSGIGIPVAWAPEPSAWGMMLAGLGLLGVGLRRNGRRRQAGALFRA